MTEKPASNAYVITVFYGIVGLVAFFIITGVGLIILYSVQGQTPQGTKAPPPQAIFIPPTLWVPALILGVLVVYQIRRWWKENSKDGKTSGISGLMIT